MDQVTTVMIQFGNEPKPDWQQDLLLHKVSPAKSFPTRTGSSGQDNESSRQKRSETDKLLVGISEFLCQVLTGLKGAQRKGRLLEMWRSSALREASQGVSSNIPDGRRWLNTCHVACNQGILLFAYIFNRLSWRQSFPWACTACNSHPCDLSLVTRSRTSRQGHSVRSCAELRYDRPVIRRTLPYASLNNDRLAFLLIISALLLFFLVVY